MNSGNFFETLEALLAKLSVPFYEGAPETGQEELPEFIFYSVYDVPSLHGCGKEVMTTFNVTFNIYTSGQNKKRRSAEINAKLEKLLTESGFARRSGSFGLSNDFPRYYHRITEFYTVADNAT